MRCICDQPIKSPTSALVLVISPSEIATRVPDGKVFAVDIEPDMLRYLGERARRQHLSVVMPVLATTDSSNLPEPVDLILVVNIYHHIESRQLILCQIEEFVGAKSRSLR